MLKKNILVTGGCGFIGSNFVNKLLNFKHNIIIIDNFSTGYIENLKELKKNSKKKNVKIYFFKFNLNEKKKLKKIFQRFNIDYIFHFAAFTSVEKSLQNPKKFLSNNIKSTKNLLDLTIKHKVKHFIFSSSAAVYGNIKFNNNINENVKPRPINPYGLSKLICEKKIAKIAKKYKFKYCIFRYFNAIGKNISKKVEKKRNLNLFEKILLFVKQNKKFIIHGKNLDTKDGTPIRDFISIYDLIKAHLECLKQADNKKFWNRTYNIGNNKGISVFEVLNQYNKTFRKKIKYKFINGKKGLIRKSVANNKKFIKASDWKPVKSNIKFLVNNFFNN